MLYTSDQMIEDFRSDVGDRADVDASGNPRDTLWSDTDILRYLNSALARWARDTLALRRVYTFDTLANDPLIRFPWSEIITVLSVGMIVPSFGWDRELREFNLHDGWIDDDYGIQITRTFEIDRAGVPKGYTRDYDDTFLRIWPVPTAVGVLTINAYVMPSPLVIGQPLPNIMGQIDLDLVMQWMKNLAYRKQDSDVIDLDRADSFKAEYLRDIKDRKSEIDQSRRDGGIMKPRG